MSSSISEGLHSMSFISLELVGAGMVIIKLLPSVSGRRTIKTQ